MPKKKIKKSVSKRFEVTKTGKVMFGHQYNGHHMTSKSGSRKRRLKKIGVLSPSFGRKIKKMLGYI